MSQDNFIIIEQISESPTASVFKAHQTALGRTVLLKILHKHLLWNKDLVLRFTREARACAMLKSENIVQIYSLTEIDGAPAIVMEFVEGKSLADLLSEVTKQDEEFATKIAKNVLTALDYAHQHGVVHRDIKPANILIDANGAIKVTDFGLATMIDTPAITVEGSLVGTPAYMSPEQARGELVDGRADLFSLGVTLIEVLTGEKIFATNSYAECIGKILHFEIGQLDFLKGKCSEGMFNFITKLMNPDREMRFQSAKEALEFLDSLNKFGKESVLRVTPNSMTKKTYTIIFMTFVTFLLLLLAVFLMFKRSHQVITLKSANSRTQTSSVDSIVKNPNKSLPVVSGNIQSPHVVGSKSVKNEIASTVQKIDTSVSSVNFVNPVDSGYISIACIPWARIYVDEEYAGTTPIAGTVKIPAGRHSVTFSNPLFVPITKNVLVEPKSLTTVDANFYDNAGYIFVNALPWGEVYVDDQYRDTTPLRSPLVVSAGIRRIRVHNPSYGDVIKAVNVAKGDTLKLVVNFISKAEK
ncbi:MAG: protein kinase domain-containing protein [Candidatus Kryptoniota bacterium]